MNTPGFRTRAALIAFLAITAFFLLTEHTAHVFGVLPFLFLLACPLMHVFMHRGGHGSHGGAPHSGHDAAGHPPRGQ